MNRDFDYEKCVEELKATQLSTAKYTYGKEMLDKMFDVQAQKVKKAYFERD